MQFRAGVVTNTWVDLIHLQDQYPAKCFLANCRLWTGRTTDITLLAGLLKPLPNVPLTYSCKFVLRFWALYTHFLRVYLVWLAIVGENAAALVISVHVSSVYLSCYVRDFIGVNGKATGPEWISQMWKFFFSKFSAQRRCNSSKLRHEISADDLQAQEWS